MLPDKEIPATNNSSHIRSRKALLPCWWKASFLLQVVEHFVYLQRNTMKSTLSELHFSFEGMHRASLDLHTTFHVKSLICSPFFFSPLTIYKSETVTTLFSKSWTNKAEDYLRPFIEKSKQIAISRRLHKQRCASKVPGSWRKSPCGADDACWGIASTQACWDEAAVARQPAASWQSGLQPLLPLFHIATYYDDHHVFQMDPWTCRRKPNRSHESS